MIAFNRKPAHQVAQSKDTEKGLTLVEVLVVVAIIGLMMAVLLY